ALVNAGMSLPALMALLGHQTPEMTLRYATLASPTLRTAYDEAMGKMRGRFTLTPVERAAGPDRIAWLDAEMIKTRVAHGYCSREPAAEACQLREHLRELRQLRTGRRVRPSDPVATR
ncbi:MAG: hypothetical protein WCF04_14980, partial [Candidatus Nanopelagicales bacterium]